MVRLSAAKNWRFKEFKYICEDASDQFQVTKIGCIVCSEFYGKKPQEHEKLQGQVKTFVKRWVNGSDVIKKSNAQNHLKSNNHTIAVNRLREKTKATSGQQIATISSSRNQEKTIVEHARILSKTEKAQLIQKFQLVHFLTVNNKSLNFYRELVCFEKEVYKVDVGTGYLNKTAAQEILLFLSRSMITENIAESLNSGDRTYFSLLTDSSSSAKTMNEKEPYVIKTRDKGKPRFDVLALEQLDDAGAKGLKESLDNAVKKANVSIDKKTHETGLGSDGTNTNKVLYKLEKE